MPQNLQSVNQRARRLVMGVPTLWLLLLFLLPFLIVLKLSFSQERLTIPPYAPLLEWINGVPHPALHSVHTAGCHCSSPGTISCSGTSSGINSFGLLPQPASAPAELTPRILKKSRRSIDQSSSVNSDTRRNPPALDFGDGKRCTCPCCA